MRVEKTLLIVNKLGLHARAATQLAMLVKTFESEVTVKQGEKSASAASVLGLMLLESYQGREIQVICEGSDADAAMAAVETLIAERFNEQE